MVRMDVSGLGGTCSVPTRRLLVYGGEQAVSIEHVISGRCILRSGPRRARHRIPLEGVQVGGCRTSLQNSLTEGIVAVRCRRAEDTEGSQAVCIIVNICCSRAIYRFLRDVAVIVICESSRNNFFSDSLFKLLSDEPHARNCIRKRSRIV
jgi:hypothetical protein